MDIIEQLSEASRTRPEQLQKLKDTGMKLVGYTGSFVPEELIYASGATPYMLCRGGEPEPPETVLPYMLRILNPYARAQTGYFLLGVDPIIPMLDLIIAECSDCHMARLADLFDYFRLPTARLGIPPDWEKRLSYDYYSRGLIRLKEQLEALSGNEISELMLREATESINELRSLLMKINELRKRQPPPIGGYDFIRLNHYSHYCNLKDVTEKLSDLYQQLKTAKSPFDQEAPRILLAGRVLAVGDYVLPKLMEALGAVVVVEFLDQGTRHFLWNVKTEGDMIANMAARYYLERIPPSVFQPAWEKRTIFIEKLVKDFGVHGVVWYQLSFEEIYDMECAIVSRAMEREAIPFLKLESSFEYSREAMGPLTTRVESFIESIKQKQKRGD